jgi:hypothetical protein
MPAINAINAFDASALAARPTTGIALPNTKVQFSVKKGANSFPSIVSIAL